MRVPGVSWALVILALLAGLASAVIPAESGTEAARIGHSRPSSPSGDGVGGLLLPPTRRFGMAREGPARRFTPRTAYMKAACELPARWALDVYRGWRPGPSRATDLVTVPARRNYSGSWSSTSHAGPYDYLQEVPLVFYGPGFIKPLGRLEPKGSASLADVAPTLAHLLGLEMPQARGAPVTEILRAEATRLPRLILTVSIDGGGWNVLNRWPGAWPQLRKMMSMGASLEGVRVGSSPSVTPPVHATISTGTYPRHHGVTAIVLRSDGGEITGAFRDLDNDHVIPLDPNRILRTPTLGDLWDREKANRPKVGLIAAGNYALGMLGHGAAFPGGDRDLASLHTGGHRFTTDRRHYSLPRYINAGNDPVAKYRGRLDRADGQLDGLWRGHLLDGLPVVETPVLGPWETQIALDVMRQEKYGKDRITDLFYIHYKSPDQAGHRWNMISPQMRDVLRSIDAGIGDLVGWLDRSVGSDDYVLIVTADHGQSPLQAGGWPISPSELVADIEDRFDHVVDNRTVLQDMSANVLFTSKPELKVNGVTPRDIASFLTRYTIADNLQYGSTLPEGYEHRGDDLVYSAAFPGRDVLKVAMCTGALPS